MAMRPMRPVASSPTRVHVRPASVDLYTPVPTEMWLRMNGSPVPAQTMFALDGATASAPTDDTGWSSKIGAHVRVAGDAGDGDGSVPDGADVARSQLGRGGRVECDGLDSAERCLGDESEYQHDSGSESS